MSYTAELADALTLLDDLLEASAALYHRSVAVIQTTISEQYFQVLRDCQAQDVLHSEQDLLPLRLELKALQAGMIREQREIRHDRDEKIRAYVAALNQRGAAA